MGNESNEGCAFREVGEVLLVNTGISVLGSTRSGAHVFRVDDEGDEGGAFGEIPQASTGVVVVSAQDAYCAKVEAGHVDAVEGTPFPEDLQWEALVDVLRGRVKVQIHCYETVDIDDVVRVSAKLER